MNRYYYLANFNSAVFLFIGATLGMRATTPESWGQFIAALIFITLGASLGIMAPALKDPPPTYEDLKKLKRQLWKNLFA